MTDSVVVVTVFVCPVCGGRVMTAARPRHYQTHVDEGRMARRVDPTTGRVDYFYQAALLVEVDDVGATG